MSIFSFFFIQEVESLNKTKKPSTEWLSLKNYLRLNIQLPKINKAYALMSFDEHTEMF